jgi:pimeloyl-ACP methyl ester carboxylesterase
MPVLFLHGVPATSRLWRPILSMIDYPGEVEAPDLPGFAEEPPAGWVPTKESYLQWGIKRLEALHESGGPVHLVGHDWGCLLALRIASMRPELLRSLAVGNGPIDPHWPLHMLWREWMMPGVGEQLSDQLVSMGFPDDDAKCNSFTFPGNARRIMGLYRSAVNIGQEWAKDLAKIVIPTMFIWGERDLIVPAEIGRRMASRIGAEFVSLDADHFWPYEAPKAATDALHRLWRRAEKLPYTILTQPPFGTNQDSDGQNNRP